jgi:putative ABC transport system ATP-binding protein
MDIIRVENLDKEYGQGNAKVQALRKIKLTIEKGEMVAIMGPSGSGKSTLLNILGCIDKATNGHYYLDGNDVSGLSNRKLAKLRNKMFGFIVQNFALLEDYTAFENIAIPLEYSGIRKKKRKEIIFSLAKKLGIDDKLNRTPKELSGGQNQRVAIARALANNPEIILADEPTGALDRKTGEEVMEIFGVLNREGKTVIVITHDENVSKKCNRTLRIEDGNIVK